MSRKVSDSDLLKNRIPSLNVSSISDNLFDTNLADFSENIRSIPYDQIIPNEENFFSLDNDEIEILADSIENNGLMHNLVVQQMKDSDKYKLISGHRRWYAIKKIIEERDTPQEEKERFLKIDCFVIEADKDPSEVTLMLLDANMMNRQLSIDETMQAVRMYKNVYSDMKKKGISVKGKMREFIADKLKLSTFQIQKYITVDNYASEEVKEQLRNGEITLENAYAETVNDRKKVAQEPKKDKDEIRTAKLKKLRTKAEKYEKYNKSEYTFVVDGEKYDLQEFLNMVLASANAKTKDGDREKTFVMKKF